MTQLLLDHGAHADVRNDIATSPLHSAAVGGDLATVKLLVAHGAPLHGVSELEFGAFATPAVAALRSGHVEVEKRVAIANYILFEAGRGDLHDENLDTLLHAAAFAGDSELMKTFVAAGGDPTSEDVKFLQSANGVTHTSLLDNALMSNSIEAVRSAIELDSGPLMPKDPLQRNLLSRTYDPDILKLLIDHGIDVNLADNMGQTPLHAVARINAADAARVLIEAGADVNARTTYGETPLCIAVDATSVHVLKLLLEHGADPTIPDGNGALPTALARLVLLRVDTPENPELVRDNARTVLKLLERHATQPK